MYCPSCGEEISKESEYCRHCGSEIETSSTQREGEKDIEQTGPEGFIESSETKRQGKHQTGEDREDQDRASKSEDVTDPGKSVTWSPSLPITSVFAAILLLWSALEYANVSSLIIFGIPGVLIIPRIRRETNSWIREEFEFDPTDQGVQIVVALLYGFLMLMGVASVIGTAGNDPSVGGSAVRQLTVGILTLGIMYVLAIGVVTAIRVNRKLQS
jgi:hypothetical protein